MSVDKETREKQDKIIEIFSPWDGWDSYINHVVVLLDIGLISYTSEIVEILELPDNHYIMRGSEGIRLPLHLRAQYTAVQLLKNLGESNPLIDHKVDHNLWNVYSPKLKIRVECGYTYPERLVHSFAREDVKEFWVLNYNNILYKFKPSADCREVLRKYLPVRMKKSLERVGMSIISDLPPELRPKVEQ